MEESMGTLKKMILLAGIPGSGKSTYINNYMGGLKTDDLTMLVCSADHYFIKDGIYVFNPKGLGAAHSQCQRRAEYAMHTGINLIFIDNTNIKSVHRKIYLDLATQYGYQIEIHTLPSDPEQCSLRNVHGVSREICERMDREFDLQWGTIYQVVPNNITHIGNISKEMTGLV